MPQSVPRLAGEWVDTIHYSDMILERLWTLYWFPGGDASCHLHHLNFSENLKTLPGNAGAPARAGGRVSALFLKPGRERERERDCSSYGLRAFSIVGVEEEEAETKSHHSKPLRLSASVLLPASSPPDKALFTLQKNQVWGHERLMPRGLLIGLQGPSPKPGMCSSQAWIGLRQSAGGGGGSFAVWRRLDWILPTFARHVRLEALSLAPRELCNVCC